MNLADFSTATFDSGKPYCGETCHIPSYTSSFTDWPPQASRLGHGHGDREGRAGAEQAVPTTMDEHQHLAVVLPAVRTDVFDADPAHLQFGDGRVARDEGLLDLVLVACFSDLLSCITLPSSFSATRPRAGWTPMPDQVW